MANPKEEFISIKDLKGFKMSKVLLHQAYTIPNCGTETTLSVTRQVGINLTYTIHGLVVGYKDHYQIVPLANVIVAYE